MDNQQTAIIKASYTRTRALAKANIRYIQHRKGVEGHRIIRELFGAEGSLEREQVYQLIDAAEKGTVFFRLIISPPQLEDSQTLNLAEITAQTMQTLAERLGKPCPYIAAAHAADHTPYHHVHCLALVQGRLGREDFAALRETATEAALAQRQERDQARQQQQQQQEGGQWAGQGLGIS
jgi:hypothetical protein